MIFPPASSTGYPSLFVPDKETVTLDKNLKGVSTVTLRPRTVPALLHLCGIPLEKAPRLSDAASFEEVDNAHGLVEIDQTERAARVGGHSAYFLHSVLQVLDPHASMPKSVRLPVFANRAPGEIQPGVVANQNKLNRTVIREQHVPVPEFMAKLAIAVKVFRFADIVVGFGATLVIKHSPLTINSLVAYDGSRIVQGTQWGLTVDVVDTLRGGVQSLVHRIEGKTLLVEKSKLAKLVAPGL
jgi:hypothetical protein